MREQTANASVPFVAKLGMVDLGRPATYQDVIDAPEGVVAELLDGGLYTQARPRQRHRRITMGLGTSLDGEFGDQLGKSGGWVFEPEPELHAESSVMVPDLAAWRVERYPHDLRDTVAIEVMPDWVCEVLSPSTAAKDRVLKLPRYGEAGVRWAWIVDPDLETVEVYRRDEQGWVMITSVMGDAPARLPPFDSMALALGRVWPRSVADVPE